MQNIMQYIYCMYRYTVCVVSTVYCIPGFSHVVVSLDKTLKTRNTADMHCLAADQ